MAKSYRGKPVKGYQYNGKSGYNIMKYINGKNIYFGFTPIEEDAKEYVEQLKKVNWNDDLVPLEFKKRFNENKKKNHAKKSKGYSKNTRDEKYTVRKYINGKVMHFGVVPNEKEAKRYVKALKECNYQTEYLPSEFKKYVPKRKQDEPRYYHKSKNGYQVSKTINNKNQYFGVFPTEELAKKAVEELKKYDWDLEKYRMDNKDSTLFSFKSFEINKHLKKNTYKNNVGSLSNPIYNDNADNKWDKHASSLSGTYQRKEKTKIEK